MLFFFQYLIPSRLVEPEVQAQTVDQFCFLSEFPSG